jgi:hypothetical protein
MRRLTLVVSGLILIGCATSDLTGPRSLPRVHADLLTPPNTPTPISAAIVATDGVRATMRVEWQDNATDLDEFITCARVTGVDDRAVTTQCAYAADYDQPVGSTGVRTADLIVPTGGPYIARLYATRWVDVEISAGVTSRISVRGAESEAIAVAGVVVTTTTRGKKR